MLVALASKNAILIVQFGNLLRAQGMPVAQAAVEAAKTRLRPILMTSFAFIFGIMPLVFASGAGQSQPAFAGHRGRSAACWSSTLLNLFVIPVLCTQIIAGARRIASASERRARREARAAQTPE